jgi:hypothetical protein
MKTPKKKADNLAYLAPLTEVPRRPNTDLENILINITEAEAEGVRVLTHAGAWDTAANAPDYRVLIPMEETHPQVRDAALTITAARHLRHLINACPSNAEIVWATMNMDSHFYACTTFPHVRAAIARPGGPRKESPFAGPVRAALAHLKKHPSKLSKYGAVLDYLKTRYSAKATGGNDASGRKIKEIITLPSGDAIDGATLRRNISGVWALGV